MKSENKLSIANVTDKLTELFTRNQLGGIFVLAINPGEEGTILLTLGLSKDIICSDKWGIKYAIEDVLYAIRNIDLFVEDIKLYPVKERIDPLVADYTEGAVLTLVVSVNTMEYVSSIDTITNASFSISIRKCSPTKTYTIPLGSCTVMEYAEGMKCTGNRTKPHM